MINIKELLYRNSKKQWKYILIAFFIYACILSGIILLFPLKYFLIIAVFTSAFIIYNIFYLIDRLRGDTEREILASRVEIAEQIIFNKYIHSKSPLLVGGYTISAHFLNQVLREVKQHKPKLILECGSGSSTVAISYILKENQGKKLISIDHIKEYGNFTRNLIRDEGLEDICEVVYAPLKKYEINGTSYQWYHDDFIEELNGEKIDMVIVDGPPKTLQKLSRYPLLPILKEHLAEDCVILMDDGNRKDETKIAHLWAKDLNYEKFLNPDEKGYWVLKNKI